jgi:hypothetical protein
MMPLVAATGAAGVAAVGLFLRGAAAEAMADTVAGLRRAFDTVGEVH